MHMIIIAENCGITININQTTMAQESVQESDGKDDEKETDFTGHWKLKTSENLDAFLKDEGYGWIS